MRDRFQALTKDERLTSEDDVDACRRARRRKGRTKVEGEVGDKESERIKGCQGGRGGRRRESLVVSRLVQASLEKSEGGRRGGSLSGEASARAETVFFCPSPLPLTTRVQLAHDPSERR
jgi:hypothetical protein